MNETYVGLETAKLLRKVGFNRGGKALIGEKYYPDSEIRHWYNPKENNVAADYIATVPTLSTVQQWLREVHLCSIEVNSVHVKKMSGTAVRWKYKVCPIGLHDSIDCLYEGIDTYNSYEEALEAGINSYLIRLLNHKNTGILDQA